MSSQHYSHLVTKICLSGPHKHCTGTMKKRIPLKMCMLSINIIILMTSLLPLLLWSLMDGINRWDCHHNILAWSEFTLILKITTSVVIVVEGVCDCPRQVNWLKQIFDPQGVVSFFVVAWTHRMERVKIIIIFVISFKVYLNQYWSLSDYVVRSTWVS